MIETVRYIDETAIVRPSSFAEAVEVAASMRDRDRSSSEPKRGDAFYEYDTFEDACAAFVSGSDGPRDQIETLRESVRRRVASMDLAAFRFDHSMIGSFLDVDSFLAGESDCMLVAREDVEKRRERFVRIVVDNAFSHAVKTDDIRTRGAAVIALCDVLNLAGYSTEVFVVSGSETDGARMALIVPVQRVGDPWDVRSAAFPLASGDFSRRLKFGVTEGLRDPFGPKLVRHGYGRPMPTSHGSIVDVEVGGADVIVDTNVGSISTIVRDPFAWIIGKCRNLGVLGDDETN